MHRFVGAYILFSTSVSCVFFLTFQKKASNHYYYFFKHEINRSFTVQQQQMATFKSKDRTIENKASFNFIDFY